MASEWSCWRAASKGRPVTGQAMLNQQLVCAVERIWWGWQDGGLRRHVGNVTGSINNKLCGHRCLLYIKVLYMNARKAYNIVCHFKCLKGTLNQYFCTIGVETYGFSQQWNTFVIVWIHSSFWPSKPVCKMRGTFVFKRTFLRPFKSLTSFSIKLCLFRPCCFWTCSTVWTNLVLLVCRKNC